MIASQVGANVTWGRYFHSTVDDKGSFAVSRTHAPLTALRLSAFHFFQLNAPDVSTKTEAHVRRSEILRACFTFEYSVWTKVGFMTGGWLGIIIIIPVKR